MKVLTVTCDRCKKEILKDDQVWTIEVRYACQPYNPEYVSTSLVIRGEWCRQCMEDMHIMPSPIKHEITTPKPTLEDFIREIAREEIQSLTGAC